MISTVYGVDFSGAKRAGPTTWVASMEPTGRDRSRLKLTGVWCLGRLCGSHERSDVLAAMVRMIRYSRGSLWGLGFPFGLPVEVMAPGCPWAGQFDYLAGWGEDAWGAGVECLRRAKALGGAGHVRRQTDTEEKTPFDAYHYRIIYQTFYGMRDVLGPLRPVGRTAILPFQYWRLPRALRVVVEACPASTLKRMGLPHQNFKQPAGGPLTRVRRRNRRAILDGLAGAVEIPPTLRLKILRDGGGDALDAVISGVGAWRCWREYDHRAIGRHPRYSREGCHYA